MNGHILHNLPIAVDCFLKKTVGFVKLHFLTHIHSDHTVGLDSSWTHPIYCTFTTANLLKHKFNISPQVIYVLEVGETHIVQCGYSHITVTVFPANHCPGSCMFLFETNNQKVLYTGDFRLNSEIVSSIQRICSGSIIDILYLDNTYCEPVCQHPSKNTAVDMIVQLCQKHCNARIMIGTSWTGHESLLIDIATKLKEYVFVDEKMMNRLKVIGVPDVFRVGKSSRLNAVANHQLNRHMLKQWNSNTLTIGIKPTAMYGNTVSTIEHSAGKLFAIPYSNHCNFEEIYSFVEKVKPAHIIPIVAGRHARSGMESCFRADMSQFNHLLHPKKPNNKNCIEKDNFTEADDYKDKVSSDIQISSSLLCKKNLNPRKRQHLSTTHNNHKCKLSRGVVFDNSDPCGNSAFLECKNDYVKQKRSSKADCKNISNKISQSVFHKRISHEANDLQSIIEDDILVNINQLL